MPLNLVFLGAKKIGADCFRYLLSKADQLSIHVCGLRSRSGEQGKQLIALGNEAGVPILESLDELPECDIIFSVQHHELLKEQHLKRANKIALNLHLAPLPEYRGCNQFTFAILDEAREFGVTIHQMDTLIDHGNILFENRFLIPKNCWVKELFDLAEEEALTLFKKSLPNIVSGNYSIKPQKELKVNHNSQLHYRHEIQDIKEIPLNLPFKKMEKRIRATMMPGFEPPYCIINGEKVYFVKKTEWHV